MDYTPFVLAFGLLAVIITLMGGIILSLRDQLRQAKREAHLSQENYRFEFKRVESLTAQLNEARSRLAQASTRRAGVVSVAQRKEAVAEEKRRYTYPERHSAFTSSPSPTPAPDPFLNPALHPAFWPATTPSPAPEPACRAEPYRSSGGGDFGGGGASSSWESSSNSESSSSSSSDSGSSSSSSD